VLHLPGLAGKHKVLAMAADDGQTPGLGSEDFPGFPTDACPEALPDISRHHSSLADVLKEDPDLYNRLKDVKTSNGTNLARCIKVGIDNRGHHMVKTIGLVAGDEECYDVFRSVFDKVIKRHLDFPNRQICDFHPTNFGITGLSLPPADPSGRFVISSQVRASRCLKGFRFPPAMTLDERREVERISVRALEELSGSLQGEYFPLSGSQSHKKKVGGMDAKDVEVLRKAALLFEAPDSTLRLCTGAGRHWPEGRGVFVNSSQSFAAWVNEQEHLRLVAMENGDQLLKAFKELLRAMDILAAAISREGPASSSSEAFSWSNRLGFLTSNPANLGTAMHISVMVKLPLLGSLENENMKPPAWRAWCARQRVQVRGACSESGLLVPGLYEVSNTDRVGLSEVEIVSLVNEVLQRIVHMELRMEADQDFADLMETPVKLAASSSQAESDRTSLEEVNAKARASLLYGFASGRLTNALLSAGGKDPTSAALAATAASVTNNAPLPSNASAEQMCAQVLTNSLVSAVIVNDDKYDRGEDVAISPTPPPEASSDDLNVLRKKMQCMLVGALEDGSLEKSLEQDQSSIGGAPDQTEEIRLRMQNVLVGALEDGTLQKTLSQEPKVPEQTEELRLKLQGFLVGALEDGSLENSLLAQDSIAEIRLKMQDLLMGALEDGSLEKSLTQIPTMEVAGPGAPQASSRKVYDPVEANKSVPSIPTSMNRAMTEEWAAEDEGSVDDLVGKMHTKMLAAAENGSLQAAMQKTLQEAEQEIPIEDLVSKLQSRIDDAVNDGKLDQIFDAALSTDVMEASASFKPSQSKKTDRGAIFVDDVPDLPPGAYAPREDAPTAQDVPPAPAPSAAAPPAPPPSAPPTMPPNELSAEDIRLRALETLTQAAADNNLEKAVSEVKAEMARAEAVSKEEELRRRARETLVKAAADKSLENVLWDVQRERQPQPPPTAAVEPMAATPSTPSKDPVSDVVPLGTPAAPVKLANKIPVGDNSTLLMALEAVSQRDRRVGELVAMISETKRFILERNEQCQAIEEKIGATRVNLAHLDLDVEWHRQALENAKDRTTELEAGQRKLMVDLDGQQQKLRHTEIEARESCLASAQSEISTATGGATASSLGCYTPRNIQTMILDPLGSSPNSARW
jgi:creatine kinase